VRGGKGRREEKAYRGILVRSDFPLLFLYFLDFLEKRRGGKRPQSQSKKKKSSCVEK